MGTKTKQIDKKTGIISDLPEPVVGEPYAVEPKPASKLPAVGTIIKTYVQNGLRYNRVVNDNGGTIDVRA